jgi:hypothetical protein
MPKKKRITWRTILIIFLLMCLSAITGGIIWLHHDGDMMVSHPLIAQYAGEKIDTLLNASCTVEKAFLSPLGKLKMRTVTIRREMAPRCSASVCFSRVSVSFRLFPMLRNFKAIVRAVRSRDKSACRPLLENFRLLKSVQLSGGEAHLTCNDTSAARLVGADCRMSEFDSAGLPHRLDFRLCKAVTKFVTIDSLITSLRLPSTMVAATTLANAFAPGNDGADKADTQCEINMRTITLHREIAPGCSASVSFPRAKALCRFFPIMITAQAMLRNVNRTTTDGLLFNCSDAFRSLQHYLFLITNVQLLGGDVRLTHKDTIAAHCSDVDFRIGGFNPAGLPRNMNFRSRKVIAGHVGIDSVTALVHFLSGLAPQRPLPTGPADTGSADSWGLRLKMRAPFVKIDSIGVMDSVIAVAEFGAVDDPIMYLSTILFESTCSPVRTKLQLTAKELSTDRMPPFKEISIMAYLNGDTLELKQGSGHFNSTHIEVAGRYTIRSGHLAYGKIDLRGLDLGMFYQSLKNSPGYLSGTADITINLYAGRLQPNALCGDAVIRGANLFARDIPVQRAPVLRRYFPDFQSLTFSTIEGEAKIHGHRIEIPGLWAQGDPLSFTISGAMDVGANMNFKLYGWLPTRYVKTLPLTVRESLVPELYDNYSFHCAITGTFKNPTVTLDRSHYARAVKGVLTHFGKSILKFFGRNTQ